MDAKVINYLTNLVGKGKCVLILGPEFINIDTPGDVWQGSIHNYLAEKKFGDLFRDDKDRYIAEDGFWFFNGNEDRDLVARDNLLSTMAEFYGKLPLTPSYEKLAQLPFSMVVSLSPDTLIAQAVQERNRPFQLRKYSTAGFQDFGDPGLDDWGEPLEEGDQPKKDAPVSPAANGSAKKKPTLIYNLFGDYRYEDNLLFTFDNLFKFLDKIFQHAAFPQFKARIAEAGGFIFLGFSYDKWYLKLVFFLLNKFRANAFRDDPLWDALQKCSKYAIFDYAANGAGQPDQKIDFFECNFGLTFSPEKEKDFIDALFNSCKDRGLLQTGTPPAKPDAGQPGTAGADPGREVPGTADAAKDTGAAKAGQAPGSTFKVLYMGSSPEGKLILRQGEEYQVIRKELNPAWFTLLEPTYNFKKADIQTQVNKNSPTILYISCHGSAEGDLILSDDKRAPTRMPLTELAEIIRHLAEVHKQLQCIVFSACRSELQAREISTIIPCCIGMRDNVDESVSNVFTSGFFEGFIGQQSNLEYAFNNGIGLLKTSDDPQISQFYKIPVMYRNGTIVPSNLQS